MTSPVSRLLVVGIGNLPLPRTRHSVGHLVLDSLAHRCGTTLAENGRLNGFIGDAQVTLDDNPTTLTFFKPKALMNILGNDVAKAVRETVPNASHMIVIHDTLNYEPAVLKAKFSGSASGHRGIRSIISKLHGSQDFYRLQIGIGRAGKAAEYVLGPLGSYEKAFWGQNGEGIDLVWGEIEKIAKRIPSQQATPKQQPMPKQQQSV